MKTVISYRYNGEIIKDLEVLLVNVCSAFKFAGINPYCVYFEHYKNSRDRSPAEMMQLAFSHIDNSDFLFVIQASEARSEGMLIEIGYAIARDIKVVVATKKGVSNTYLPSMGDYAFEYVDIQDLIQQIKEINFTPLVRDCNSGETCVI